MAKRRLVVAMIAIIIGVSLVAYIDPHLRQAFSPSTSTSRSLSGSGSLAQATSYNALDIIESLLGVGLVGVGLVLVGVEIFSPLLKQY